MGSQPMRSQLTANGAEEDAKPRERALTELESRKSSEPRRRPDEKVDNRAVGWKGGERIKEWWGDGHKEASHFAFCISHFALCISHFAFRILHFALCISHFAFRTLHLTHRIALAFYLTFYFALRPLYLASPTLPLHVPVA